MNAVVLGRVERIDLDNFSRIQKVVGNRQLDNKVNQLVKEIEEHGQIVPIILMDAPKGRYWLIDGQHRLQACARLRMSVIAYIMPEKKEKLLSIISAQTSHAWTIKNFIDSRCVLGDENYIRFRDCLKTYSKVNPRVVYSIATGTAGGQYEKLIRQNKFEFEYNGTEKMLNQVNVIQTLVLDKRAKETKRRKSQGILSLPRCSNRNLSEFLYKALSIKNIDFEAFKTFCLLRYKDFQDGSDIMYHNLMPDYREAYQLDITLNLNYSLNNAKH